ncbi:nicotinate (nicotinamide) nucleotide adenylyltransferase [Gemmatimonas groenlandica]|uniref:Probable nicotinate-nucleotide adenylyltransferase n=1 Tax=Gemmatimonas groenlandica TaxID=2732249 RepID=A0A6M4IJN4_9BACT|nr:nicotinate (nicotinamide) nucleotide adenylyltransferase [Gemmatimonas groenlandica]QJR34830.1 nicotinate (nicotinamide) nucleotide adenylyltransferase [Gemmatimonas groenlandica]
MRIGILGGSFDPPHVGHLLVAQDALDELALERLLIVPAAQQPLKDGKQTPAAHRLAMVEACFGGIPRIEVDPIEIDRGGLSFMVDTVESLRRRWPSAMLHLLVGDDVVSTLPRWRDVTRLLSMVQLIVLHRADRGHDVAALTVPLASVGASTARRLATRRVDLSSTEIRARVRDSRSIRGFVPDAVATYIATTGLYLENSRELSAAEGPARA